MTLKLNLGQINIREGQKTFTQNEFIFILKFSHFIKLLFVKNKINTRIIKLFNGEKTKQCIKKKRIQPEKI